MSKFEEQLVEAINQPDQLLNEYEAELALRGARCALALLRRYVKHHVTCSLRKPDHDGAALPCDCELDALLADEQKEEVQDAR